MALVNVDWGFFPTAFEIDGALVAWPKEVARVVGRAGPLSAQEVRSFAGQLAHRLKPAYRLTYVKRAAQRRPSLMVERALDISS